ncbi:MAG: chemotaxis protein CheA [Pirellulaceae bacterium]|nr:chemotaxis protein CheA [Pirellulaceae bacterium]
MQIDMSQFRAAFYVEAAEHLQCMEAALLQLENAPRDTELLNTIFRGAHSIKGASTTFGIDEVGRFTHVLENLLERLRDGIVDTTSELIELLLTSVDIIDALVANAKDGSPMPDNMEQVLNELRRVNGQSQAASTPKASAASNVEVATKNTYRVALKPSREFFRFGQDPLLLLRELTELGTVIKNDLNAGSLPPLAELEPEQCYLSWTLEIATEKPEQAIHEVFMFLDAGSSYTVEAIQAASPTAVGSDTKVESTNPAAATAENQNTSESKPLPGKQEPVTENRSGTDRRAASAPKPSVENETVRVDRQRLDELINQIGELVIGASMVEQEVVSITGGRGLESLSGLGKIVRDLQEMSLGLRMVPIAATFQKMNRVIRDVAKKVGKQINFVTSGDETELDKSVVDQISDPLVHMVRNAADHGIETPEDRIAAGKPAEGTVTLRAYQQGGNVYIELIDDGRGLNRKRIMAKAVERGLIPADANLSDAEICNLIFLPGFSTAAAVTDVSGRGVGMDVVRRNVEALQGSVSVKSEEGKGSTITVRLPLTLAILDGLLVRLSDEVFVIPLLSVIESICVNANEIHRIVGVGEVISLRGEVVPLLRLHHALNIKGNEQGDEQGLLVIVEDQGRRLALRVDDLIGQQQVVIKNLETNFRKVPGVSGATILGDGHVALILDIFGLSNLNYDAPSHVAEKTAELSVN